MDSRRRAAAHPVTGGPKRNIAGKSPVPVILLLAFLIRNTGSAAAINT